MKSRVPAEPARSSPPVSHHLPIPARASAESRPSTPTRCTGEPILRTPRDPAGERIERANRDRKMWSCKKQFTMDDVGGQENLRVFGGTGFPTRASSHAAKD